MSEQSWTERIGKTPLSARLRADVECAPWVVHDVRTLETDLTEANARIAELEAENEVLVFQTSGKGQAAMNKQVEVWCSVDTVSGEVDAVDLDKRIVDPFHSTGRLERRLIVKPGDTFSDGVREAIRLCEQRADSVRDGSAVARQCAQDIRALSPAPEHQVIPSESDRLLREIASIWRPAAGEYDGLLERMDTYLKEKG